MILNVHLSQIPDWFNHASTAAVFAMSFWRGGGRVRLLASLLMAMSLGSHWLCATIQCWSGAPPLAMVNSLANDVLILAAGLLCVRGAKHYWTLWFSSFVLLSLITDLSVVFVGGFSPWAYGSALVIWSYLMKAALLWGALSHRRPLATMAAA